MNKLYKIGLFLLVVFFSSCSDFLNEAPDNRIVIDNPVKVRNLLTSAYPGTGFTLLTEFGTDNIVDEGEDNLKSTKVFEQMAYWEDLTQSDNDDSKSGWQSSYSAISSANEALEAIDNIGGDLKNEKAEALIVRAYSHFLLVNVFSKHYNPSTADTDLGITYMFKPETELYPKYKRETVKAIYEKIDADIEAALPNISDDIYEQPKYHFNKKAAYAFAARFNLYYGKWDKAIKYADIALSSASLVDWSFYNTMVDDHKIRATEYLKSDGIFLEHVEATSGGLVYGPRLTSARINHTSFISSRETVEATMPWGQLSKISYSASPTMLSGANFQKVLFAKIPALFEYVDAVSGSGYARSVYTDFTADETLLVRAEAKIHLLDLKGAIEDLNKFTTNFFKGEVTTLAAVNEFYDSMSYSNASPNGLTQKKKLTPVGFSVAEENMIHYVLQCRRLLTLHEGLRWFDIKRYGIEVNRFKENRGTYELQDQLTVGDNRRAIQLPSDVISSGVTANPRK